MGTHKNLIKDLRLFALEIVQRKVKLSANDICYIDWPNFLMVRGVVQTLQHLFNRSYQSHIQKLRNKNRKVNGNEKNLAISKFKNCTFVTVLFNEIMICFR